MKRGSFVLRVCMEKRAADCRPYAIVGSLFPNKKTTHCKAMGGGGAKHLTFY